MTGDEEFEALRPLLFSIAYRICDNVSEAEDAVEEIWVRYQASDAVLALHGEGPSVVRRAQAR